MTRIIAFMLGIGFLSAAALGYLDLSSLGFPHGHLTVFKQETRSVRVGALVVNALLGLLGLAAGLGWFRSVKAVTLALCVDFALVAVPSAILLACPATEACVQIYETITGHVPDHGRGG